jgi:hypothetical protein
MKTLRLLITAVAGIAALGRVFAANPPANSESNIEVTYVHPENFADVRDAYMGSDKGRDGLLAELKDYIVSRAKSYVPADQKLLITVTDVDLAGDFEPWRGPNSMDVRIVKDIYPPKIDLEYRLVRADGTVVKEGKRQLRDLAFMMKININRDDHLRFEKALLDDWLRSEFRTKS